MKWEIIQRRTINTLVQSREKNSTTTMNGRIVGLGMLKKNFIFKEFYKLINKLIIRYLYLKNIISKSE